MSDYGGVDTVGAGRVTTRGVRSSTPANHDIAQGTARALCRYFPIPYARIVSRIKRSFCLDGRTISRAVYDTLSPCKYALVMPTRPTPALRATPPERGYEEYAPAGTRAVYDTLSPCQSALVGKDTGRPQAAGEGCGSPPGRAAILAAMRAGSPHSLRKEERDALHSSVIYPTAQTTASRGEIDRRY